MAEPTDKSTFRSALAVASVGIELAIAIILGYLVGDWLDARLDTAPVLTYVLFACGAAAGFRGVWRTARRHWPADK